MHAPMAAAGGLVRSHPNASIAVLSLVVAVAAVPVFYPSLAPTDSYVYFAAGQRLNDGHELYHLMPGDIVIASNPPYWDVPILSPPLVGVIWRPFAILGWAGMLLGWALSGAALLAAIALVTYRVGLIAAAGTLALAAPIGIQLGLGNINGVIALSLVLAWVFRDKPAVLGFLIACMAALKVTPVVLIAWVLASRRTGAFVWFLLCSMALVGVAVLGAGFDAVWEYPQVMLSTSGVGTTDLSAAGFARAIGVPANVARYVPWAVLILGLASIAWKRSDQRFGFAVAASLLIFASPVVREYWFALLLPGLAVLEKPVEVRASARTNGR